MPWQDTVLPGPVRALGLAYAAQQVPRVPSGRHDAPLDAIVTDPALPDAVRDRATAVGVDLLLTPLPDPSHVGEHP